MPRAKQAPVEMTPDEEPISYTLEPLNDDLQSRLNVVGNSMRIFTEATAQEYPGWSAMFADIFEVIRMTIEQMKEA